MAGITLSGAGSGLDIKSLVNQLVAAEGSPAESRINKREGEIKTLLSAFGRLKGSMSSFSDALDDLKNASMFKDRTAASSDEKIATVTA
ncbi:MAG TPA: flagellar cap protein, partial [Gammaproteobacteria bacterium]|nr:flagellar cap protein [Gammaproteobacteria bacterium]